jgi:hypothetical protein
VCVWRYAAGRCLQKLADQPCSSHVDVINTPLCHTRPACCRYLLQPPSRRAGSPFVITNKTTTELHLSLAQRAGTYKVRECLWLYRQHEGVHVLSRKRVCCFSSQ